MFNQKCKIYQIFIKYIIGKPRHKNNKSKFEERESNNLLIEITNN